MENFFQNTTTCGIHEKFLPVTQQNVVSKANFYSEQGYFTTKMLAPVEFQEASLAEIHLQGVFLQGVTLYKIFVVSLQKFAIDTTISVVLVETLQMPSKFHLGLKLFRFGKQKVMWKTLYIDNNQHYQDVKSCFVTISGSHFNL